MTNKEAIEILTNVKNTPQITWTNGADVAFDLAIKTLEEQEEHNTDKEKANVIYKLEKLKFTDIDDSIIDKLPNFQDDTELSKMLLYSNKIGWNDAIQTIINMR